MNTLEWNMPWLLLLALQPLLIYFLRKYFAQRNINHYVSKTLQPWVVINSSRISSNNSFILNTAYYLAWLLFAIAAAGPRIAETSIAGIDNSKKDIMVVLDISQSMHASDLASNRINVAYKKISQLINNSNHSRIGIIVYAAKPHLYTPLTYDKTALNFYLKNLKYLVPPSQGTQPLTALNLASRLLTDSNSKRSKSILLITDTDTTKENNDKLNKATPLFIKNNIAVYTLVIASSNGEAVPAFSDGWINIDGRPVISRPKPQSYQRLSEQSNGLLKKTSSNNAGITSIIDAINTTTSGSNTESGLTTWLELFYLFLLPAIILIFFTMHPYKLRLNTNLVLICIAVTSTVFINTPISANQQDDLRKAYAALTNAEYVKSRELYSSMNTFDGSFGEAISSYKLTEYTRAIRLFEKSVLLAETAEQIGKTLYNLGNSYFQIGNYTLAVSSFKQALLYQPQHAASQKNLVYAENALKALNDRKKLLAKTARAGRGPRSATAAKDVIFSDNNNVSLDDTESNDLDTINNHLDNEVDIPEFIILRGLAFADNSASNNATFTTGNADAANGLTINQINKVLDNQAVLWRRIFEIEEGYPAPLDEPESLPGVLPW